MECGRRMFRRLAGVFAARVPELGLGRVPDPRSKRGRRWKLPTLLKATLLALTAGCKGLSEMEVLMSTLSPGTRRLFGIHRRVPDTTMRDVLCRVDPQALRICLREQLRAASRRKALAPIDPTFPFGVITCDGKGTALGFWDDEYAQRHANDTTKEAYGLLRTVTCCLVTARSRPCVDAVPIPPETNEMGIFPTVFDGLVAKYGRLFQVVTYDAGGASEENARRVVEAGKDYVLRMKDERRVMLKTAKLVGKDAQPLAFTEDTLSNPTEVRREVFLVEARGDCDDGLVWTHAKTFVRVRSQTRKHGSITATDDRWFVTSLAQDRLTPSQWLWLIRAHWAVENNCHGTFDRFFREDEHPWIELCPRGAAVVLILRRIAYNALALFRAVTQRSEEKRNMPWKKLLGAVRDMLIAARDDDVDELRKRPEVALASS